MNHSATIKELMTRLNFDDSVLAKKTGFSRGQIFAFSEGHCDVTDEIAVRVSDGMNVPFDCFKILGIEEADVPEHKKGAFEGLYPMVRELTLIIVDKIIEINASDSDTMDDIDMEEFNQMLGKITDIMDAPCMFKEEDIEEIASGVMEEAYEISMNHEMSKRIALFVLEGMEGTGRVLYEELMPDADYDTGTHKYLMDKVKEKIEKFEL